MTSPAIDSQIKQQVREFYDSVGWRQIGDGIYQNARYEDLRPVSREYIRKCHMRVSRHLPQTGRRLLDAGSGPIQYPEYLEYSREFQFRVCLDISIRALKEARQRIGSHGLYVVGDVAHLPFAEAAFEAVVSLHTVHHLPPEQQASAFAELYRIQSPGGAAVIVYSWGRNSALMRLLDPLIRLALGIRRRYAQSRQRIAQPEGVNRRLLETPGTFTHHFDPGLIKPMLADFPQHQMRVWRSVSTAFLRAFVHRFLLGRAVLQLLYWLEERAPLLLGRIGQYPMILYGKPAE
jgi:SAM-dependent methyltransferase